MTRLYRTAERWSRRARRKGVTCGRAALGGPRAPRGRVAGGAMAAAGAEGDAAALPDGGSPECSLQRVKLYRLNETGVWDDKGTGHVSVQYMEARAQRGAAR